MSNYESFFNHDPWVNIKESSYPLGMQLYVNDDRFWVSRNEDNQVQFFVHEKELVDMSSQEDLIGVQISIGMYGQNSSRLVCTLTADERAVKDKFAIVVKDIAYHCSKYTGTQLFLKIQERIKSWANFLVPKHVGLSHSEYIGFWGELYAVSELLMKNHSGIDSVRFWVGPEGKKQDITMNTTAIEVKTSVLGSPRAIRISSLDQLERITPLLYLLHIVLSPSNNETGKSLGMLYESCLQYLAEDKAAEIIFLQKTSELYGKASNAQLEDRFSMVGLTLFNVKEGFPVITADHVQLGIIKAEYEISISAIKEFDVTEKLEEIIKNG